jgi:Ca2+-binding RTX toxin-like protein
LSASAVTAATIATAMQTAAGPTAPVIGGGAAVAGIDSAAGTGAYLAVSAATSLATMVRDTLTNFESVIGSGLRDYIVAGSSAGTITGGAGADTMIAGTAVDTFVIGATDSIASTARSASPASADAATITFGNGVDVIQGFNSAVDKLDLVVATAITGNGVAAANTLTAQNYLLSGSYAVATGIFTVNAAGADTLVFQVAADTNAFGLASTTNAVVLVGVSSVGAANITLLDTAII